ncbi:MAG: YfcC family protein [Aminipila sp.]
METLNNKKLKVPHVYIIIMGIALICMLLTYIIPAGAYERIINEAGREVVDPSSFHFIEQTPQNLFDYFSSFHTGLVETAGIIMFLFIVGGSFAVIEGTGAIEAVLCKITQVMAGKERLIIPFIMFTFAIGGATFGMAEEALPFIPIMVTLAISLGFDSMTGAAMVLVGCSAGFAGAFLSPFTVGVAQGIAGLPLASGMGFRIILFIAMCILMIGFVYWYAGRVKKNPKLSPMYEIDQKREDKLDLNNLKQLTKKHILILIVVALSIITFTYGVIKLGWYFKELSATFLIMAVLSAIISGMGFNGFAEHLTKGMATLASGAIIVGFARAILILLTDGGIIDTILYYTSDMVAGLSSNVAALGMYIFQVFLNFLVPSGSGQAAISMPILCPLSDIVGVTRQTAVLAYQLGDGISNIFTPTSGYFMAGLALAKIPWEKWAKWLLPLLLMEYIVGAIFIVIANSIGYGPF